MFVRVVMGKEERSVKNLFFNSYDRLFIYIHTLQYQCNTILTKQYKKEIIHNNIILWESNQT